jgi:hypothetical protein
LESNHHSCRNPIPQTGNPYAIPLACCRRSLVRLKAANPAAQGQLSAKSLRTLKANCPTTPQGPISLKWLADKRNYPSVTRLWRAAGSKAVRAKARAALCFIGATLEREAGLSSLTGAPADMKVAAICTINATANSKLENPFASESMIATFARASQKLLAMSVALVDFGHVLPPCFAESLEKVMAGRERLSQERQFQSETSGVDAGSRATSKTRHCEEHLRRSNPEPPHKLSCGLPGLPRRQAAARNDEAQRQRRWV